MAKIKPLRNNEFFADFSDREIALFSRIVDEIVFPAGSDIFSESVSSSGMYLIKSGTVEISKKVGEEEEEDSFTLSQLGQGELFGQLSLVDDGPHLITAHAIDEVEVLFIPRDKFEEFKETHQDVSNKLLTSLTRMLAEQLRIAGELFTAYIMNRPPQDDDEIPD
jgi:CRP/FNR family transcriptional regulator, cyclic AMP receptor protein